MPDTNLITGTLFGRYASVEIINPPQTSGFIIPTGMRMEFRCIRSEFASPPNSLELTISNLAATTRNQITVKEAKVRLIAGYDLAFGKIFEGTIRTVDHVRKGPDWNTVIKCGDGETAARVARSSFVVKTKGVSKLDILQALLVDLKLGNGNFNSVKPPFSIQKGMDINENPRFIPSQTTYLHGFSCNGSTVNQIINIAASLGYTFCIQNSQPQFAPVDNAAATFTTYLLNPETGLLGSPEHGSPNAKGHKVGIVKAKCLMIPQIVPGFILRMQHNRNKQGVYLSDGNYRVQKITTKGDTAGNDWECELELIQQNPKEDQIGFI